MIPLLYLHTISMKGNGHIKRKKEESTMSLFTVNLKTGIENFFFNASLLPTRIELEARANKYWRDKKKEEQKIQKEEIKKSKEQAKEEGRADIPEEVSNVIASLAKGDAVKTMKLVEKYNRANEITNYAIRYISNENAELLTSITMEEKSIVNSVATMFGASLPYPDIVCADFRRYDPSFGELYDERTNFLIIISLLQKNKSNQILMKKIEKVEAVRAEARAAEAEHPQDDPVEETEIIATEETVVEEVKSETVTEEVTEEPVNEEVKPETTVSKEDLETEHKVNFVIKEGEPVEEIKNPHFNQESPKPVEFANIDSYISELNIPHRYEKADEGLLYLFIDKGDIELYYLVDNGSYLGVPSIIARCDLPVNDGWIFVPMTCKDIVNKILTMSNYVLNAEETQYILENFYLGTNLNRYFDMTGIEEELKKATKEQKNKFALKLQFIMDRVIEQTIQKPEGIDYPRFRFEDMKSLDDFTVVSDSKVNMSLLKFSQMNLASNNICENLSFMVEGNIIVQIYMDSTVEFVLKDDGSYIMSPNTK